MELYEGTYSFADYRGVVSSIIIIRLYYDVLPIQKMLGVDEKIYGL